MGFLKRIFNTGNRDFRLDLVKLFAILLVVFDHCGQHLIPGFTSLPFYNFIFLTQMPLFMVIAGYFAKRHYDRINSGKSFGVALIRSCGSLLIPYFVFSLINYIFVKDINDGFISYAKNLILQPENSFWFLWALFIIELVAILFAGLFKLIFKKKELIGKIVSVLPIFIFAGAGMLLVKKFGNICDLKHAAYYSIFFGLGLTYGLFQEKLKFTYNKIFRLISAAIGIAAFVTVWIVQPSFFTAEDSVLNLALRVLGSVGISISVISLFSLLPNCKPLRALSWGGTITLEAYCIHLIAMNIPLYASHEASILEFIGLYLLLWVIVVVLAIILNSNKLTKAIVLGKLPKFGDGELDGTAQIKIGTLISFITIAVEIIISLVFTPWMITTIGKADYSVYTIAYSFISIFLFDFGISMSTSKFIAKFRAEGNKEGESNLLSTVLKIYLILDAVIITAMCILYFNVQNIYQGLTPESVEKLKIAYIIVGSYSVISFPFLNLDGFLNAHEKFIFLKITILLTKLVTLCLMFIALKTNAEGSLFWLLAINAGVGAIVVIIKCIMTFGVCKVKFKWKFFDKKLLWVVIGFSIWIALISLRDKLINGLIPTILGSVADENQVTLYGYGMTIITYAFTMASVFSGMFMYKVTECYQKPNSSELVTRLLIKVGKIELFMIAMIFCGFICFGKPFLVLFLDEGYEGTYLVAILLLIPFLLSIPKQVAVTAAYVQNKARPLAIINIACAVACIGICFPMGMWYGALGTAISYCVCCTTCEILSDILVYRKSLHLNIGKYYLRAYLKMFIPAAISVGLGFLLGYLLPANSKLTLIADCLIFVVIFGTLIIFLYFDKCERSNIFGRVLSKLKLTKSKVAQQPKEVINIVWVTQQFDQSICPLTDAINARNDANIKVVLINKVVSNEANRVCYERDYVTANADNNTLSKIFQEADAVIVGQAQLSNVYKHLKNRDIPVFKTGEPLYKNGRPIIKLPIEFLRFKTRHTKYYGKKPRYLAIGGSSYDDLLRFDDTYFERAYKWGYFPVSKNDVKEANETQHQEKITILWSGKYIKLKHPEMAVEAGRYLKEKGIPCCVKIVGFGEEEDNLKSLVKKNNVEDVVDVSGSLNHDKLLELMSESSIYLFSSDGREGWGMVLQEAMFEGCCPIANIDAGASRYLIKDGQNGFLYSNEKEFYDALDICVDIAVRKRIGANAKETIVQEWTTDVASERLVALIKGTIFEDSTIVSGPCTPCEMKGGK